MAHDEIGWVYHATMLQLRYNRYDRYGNRLSEAEARENAENALNAGILDGWIKEMEAVLAIQ